LRLRLLLPVVLALAPVVLPAQGKPVLVVNVFTTADGVALPYDTKQLQGQLVAELNVMLGKEFQVVAEAPAKSDSSVYKLDGDILSWKAGNAAKRLLVGFGSGREGLELQYRVTDAAGKKPVDRKDSIRTNFYSQSGSTGTLGHPIAQKVSERIRDANLR
jgi:Domain of unknown function (DUF4410)